jgi:hypothetical protein
LVKSRTKKVEDLKRNLEALTESLVSGNNLFVSQDECKAVKKQAGIWKKKVEQLEVKIAGLVSGRTKMEGG